MELVEMILKVGLEYLVVVVRIAEQEKVEV